MLIPVIPNQLQLFGFIDMASNIFEKILKIVQIVVALLEMAVKSFTGLEPSDGESD